MVTLPWRLLWSFLAQIVSPATADVIALVVRLMRYVLQTCSHLEARVLQLNTTVATTELPIAIFNNRVVANERLREMKHESGTRLHPVMPKTRAQKPRMGGEALGDCARDGSGVSGAIEVFQEAPSE